MANRFLNNITVNDSYTLPSSDGSADQVITTDGAGNLSFADVNSVIDTATEEVYYTCKNSTGSTIAKGKAVMAVGTDGNSGHILMDEMVADGSIEPKYFLGILAESVGNGNTGKVIHFGEIDQFNTTGQNGETWNDANILWCDPDSPGDFTIVEPDGPNVKIAAAIVLNASTNGKIRVRVQANEGIHDLHDTKITTQADGELLVWNNTLGVWQNDGTATVDYTNGRVGIGTPSPGASLHVGPSSLLSGYTPTTTTLAVSDITNGAELILRGQSPRLWYDITSGGMAEVYIDGAQYNILSGSPTSAGSSRFYIKADGNVGIGTTTPTAPLDTNGVRIGRDFSITNRGTVRIDSNGTSSPSDVLFGHTAAANQSAWSGVYWSLSSRGTSDSGKFQLWRGSGHASPYNSELRVITVMPSGDTGIGETDPTQKLHVGGNIRITGAYYDSNNSAGTSGQVLSSTATGTDWVSLSEIQGVDGTGTANYIAKWSDSDTITNSVIYDDGTKVGIGTGAPDATLHVESTGVTAGGYQYHAIIDDNNTYGTNKGGGIIFRGDYNSSGAKANFAAIRAGKSNSNDGNANAYLSLFYGASGALTEGIRLDYNGKVGIGTTSPSAPLHIYQPSTSGLKFSRLNHDDIDLSLEGANRFVISNTTDGLDIMSMLYDTGNVGIGTTSPFAKLQVNGDFAAEDNIYLTDAGTVRGKFELNSSDRDDVDIKAVSLGSNMKFFTVDTERMRIDSSGNVGIGTTDPSAKLEVSDSNTTKTAIHIDNTSTGGHRWDIASIGSAVSGRVGNLQIRNDSDALNIVEITGDGNVGIGTDNPEFKLHVRDQTSYGGIKVSGNNAPGITIEDDSDDAYSRIVAQNGGELRISADVPNLASGFIAFRTAGDTERMRIDSSGRILINATSTIFNDKLYINNDAYTSGGWRVGTSSTYVGKLYNSSGILTLESDSSRDIQFGSSTYGTKMYIDTSAGNVGIGNTSPDFRLHTNLNLIGTPLAYLNGTANTFDAEVNLGVTHNSTAVGTGTGAGVYLANNANNNGAPSPIIAFSALSASGSYNHTYAAIYGIKTAGGADSNWVKGDLTFATGSGTGPHRRMTITSDGNVGIGTDSPQAKLQVNGGVQMADDTDTASADKVGTLRYRADANNSYVDMCMQTGASTYEWINIVQNNW